MLFLRILFKNAAKCRNMREDIAADIPQFTRPKK